MEPFLLNMFLRSLEACYAVEAFKRGLSLLAARGFRLIAKDEDELYQDVQAGATPTLQHAFDEYVAERGEEFSLRACYLKGPEFSFELQLLPAEGLLECWVDWELFYATGENQAYSVLLETFKDLYQAWHPFYGHEEFSGGVGFTWDIVTSGQDIGYLYGINLFAPELVSKLGRERLLGAPVWRVDTLDDGGILLIPVDHRVIGGDGRSLKKVAEYLGLQTPQAPGEEWEEL